MRDKTKFVIIAMLTALCLAGCRDLKRSTQDDGGGLKFIEPTENDKFARLEVPEIVDMGIFDYETPIKTTEIVFRNSGDEKLCINGVVPECECTRIIRVDSVVPPKGIGKIVVSLDMSKYLADTIFKAIHIISNDPDKNVFEVNLMADNRM